MSGVVSIVTQPDTIQGHPLVGKYPEQIAEVLRKLTHEPREPYDDEEKNGY